MFVCRSVATAAELKQRNKARFFILVIRVYIFCVHNLRRCIEQRVRRNFPFGYWIHLLFRYYTGWYGCVGIAERFGSEYGTRATPRSLLYSFYAHTAIYSSKTVYRYCKESRGFDLKVFFITYAHRGHAQIKKENGEREKRWTIPFDSLFGPDDQQLFCSA